jgi:N-acetylglutamate synthase-like GNAT family acetyltransferase
MKITIRTASEYDQEAITALVRSERLNPSDLDWRRFLVATDARGLAGTVQLRNHFDGSLELGSLVVRPDTRSRGVAARLIDALMLFARGRVYMITGARFAAHYAHWGFAPVEPTHAPSGIQRNYFLGRLAGIASRVIGRTPNPLAVLARAA